MAIRQILSKVGTYYDELRFIDYRIKQLTCMGEAMLNNNFKAGEIIIETLPNNGARPILTPIYPAPAPLEMIPVDDEISVATTPQPLGFQRMYVPRELKNSPLLTVFMELDRNVILAIVDTTLTKLKERKKQIFEESKVLLKEEPH